MTKVKMIKESIGNVIVGKEKAIDMILVCLLARGHALIEDVPGVGKTTIVHSLAKSLDMNFKRIQFTPDLLPSDVIGISVYNQKKGEFEYNQGPIFGNILLADEINRTSPKTQSSLLEAMQEGQVTVDGVTYKLPTPFIVLATQNPIEYEGTFPLPESQIDRFMMKISIGYPDSNSQKSIFRRFREESPLLSLEPVLNNQDILEMQQEVSKIYIDEAIEEYIIDIVNKTRSHKDIRLGVSPRGAMALYRAAQSYAYLNERNYVLPDDIKNLVHPILGHRLILNPEARLRDIDEFKILNDILSDIRVPVVKTNE